MFWTKQHLLIKTIGKNVANETEPTRRKTTDLNHTGYFYVGEETG